MLKLLLSGVNVLFLNFYKQFINLSKKFFKFLLKKLLVIPFFVVSGIMFISVDDLYFGWLRSSRIGHFTADIDCALSELARNNQTGRKQRIILIMDSYICNTFVMELISRIAIPDIRLILKSGRLWLLYLEYLKNSHLFGYLFMQTVGLSSRYESILKAPPLFKIAKVERDLIYEWLEERYKLNLNNPFIFLHNRDSAYLPNLTYHSPRDFSPEIFIPVIDKFQVQYNFFRGGVLAKDPLPQRLNCVDLPFINHSDKLNVLTQEISLFYFGSDSGIHSLSTVFRKPVGIINFAPASYDFIRRANHLTLGFIPKLMINKKTNEPVGLIEMYENNWINLWSTEQFCEANLEVRENSQDEVTNFFEESLRIYNSDLTKEDIATPEQEEFWKIVTHYQPDSFGKKLILDNCFISPSFLRKNSYLFTR